MRHVAGALLFVLGLAALAGVSAADGDTATPPTPAQAVFATGCFWCSESDFEKVPGVLAVVSGYAGGRYEHPSYGVVGEGVTGHAESIEVTYDPARVSYVQLLEHFWHTHDPLDGDGQFCDRGSQYRPAVFYLDDAQKAAAEASRVQMQKRFKQPIRTQIAPVIRFWPAEDYHQDFYKNNTLRYRYYRLGCGRDARVKEVWGEDAAAH